MKYAHIFYSLRTFYRSYHVAMCRHALIEKACEYKSKENARVLLEL